MHVLPYARPLAPDELARALAGCEGLAWLDGDGVHADGRFSFLGIEPCERIELSLADAEPLAVFERFEPRRAVSAAERAALEPYGLRPCDVPAFIGYLAYDACHAPRPVRRPALAFARYDALVVFDHARRTTLLVGDDRAACERLARRIEELAHAPASKLAARVGAVSATSPAEHRAAIGCALEQIARGELYQVNLARCFRAGFEGSPLALFLALRAASPVPFGFYFTHGSRAVLCRSMERFLRWERGTRALSTRPIKGTIARTGRDEDEARALATDEKERAEHAMIVDLMRNDFGRIAEIGSVAVEALLAVEPYAKLSHLVSTVVCRTRPDTSLRALLEATFPPGSVTGTPKLRAIALIDALERVPRDAYTGAVGFVDREGGVSLSVAIRTAVVEAGEVRYYAGGGIVEASRAEHEIAETELKARVFFDAIALLQTADDTLDLSGTAVSR